MRNAFFRLKLELVSFDLGENCMQHMVDVACVCVLICMYAVVPVKWKLETQATL